MLTVVFKSELISTSNIGYKQNLFQAKQSKQRNLSHTCYCFLFKSSWLKGYFFMFPLLDLQDQILD